MKYSKILAAACLLMIGAGCASETTVNPQPMAAGDKIGGWTVEKVAELGEISEISGAYAVWLKGPVELSGQYKYAHNEALGGKVMTFRPSATDAKKIPTGQAEIMLANTDDALAALGLSGDIETTGAATFSLDDLAYNSADLEAETSATFVSLVSKN